MDFSARCCQINCLGKAPRRARHPHDLLDFRLCHIDGEIAVADPLDVQTEPVLTRRQDHDPLAATRNRDVPLLRACGGPSARVGDDYRIRRLSLGRIRSDRVTSDKNSTMPA